MLTCLLCLESDNQPELLDINKDVCENFTIKNVIEEYFRISQTIFESQLNSICRCCFKNLETFHNFVRKVENIYTIKTKHEDLIVSSSKYENTLSNEAEACDQSFIDDLIEYDEDESIEFEESEALINDLEDDKNGCITHVSCEEQTKDLSNYDKDSVLKHSKVNVLVSQSQACSSQNLLNLTSKIFLSKNLLKNSQSRFKILDFKNETKINENSELKDAKNENLHSSQNLSFFCDKGSPFSTKCKDFNDKDHENMKKSTEFKNLPEKNKNAPQNNKSQRKPQIIHNNFKLNPESTFKCEICIKIFKTSAILRSHIQKIHSDNPTSLISCKECGKSYTNKYILKTHMQKHIIDSDKAYECYICKKSSKNLPHLLNHFKYKHDPAYSTSSVCHICSKTVTRLDIHIKQMHSNDSSERVKCEICGHFMKKSSLRGHLASHNEAGLSCEACGKYLKNRNSYLCHMKRVHSDGKYKCDHCGKGFHQESRLMDHIACQHTGVYLHKCRIADCEKKFRNAGRRRMHERRMHPVEYEQKFKASYLRENLEN